MEIEFDDGSKISTDFPSIRIQAFKRKSGKWYAGKSTVLFPDDSKYWIIKEPWEFRKKIEENDPEISHMSPLKGGFDKEFLYVVESFIPSTYEGFCTMLVDPDSKEEI